MARKKQAAGSVIPADKRKEYHKSKELTAGGRPSIDTNDAVAKELRGKDLDGLQAVARKHGFEDRFKEWKRNLNFGMIRMNTGNVLRGILRGGKTKKAKTAKAPRKRKAKATTAAAA